MKRILIEGLLWGAFMFLMNTFLFNINNVEKFTLPYVLFQFLIWSGAGLIFGIANHYIRIYTAKRKQEKEVK